MGKTKKASADGEDLHPHEILRQNLNKYTNKIITKDGQVKKKIPKQFTTYKCDICNKQYEDKSNLTSHMMIHTDDCYACPTCPYVGKTKKYLSRHVKKVHSPPTGHKCGVCGKMFHYKCNLQEHAMIHTGEKPHKCNVCGKAFRVTFSLNAHMLIHTNEKPYKCSFCDYACRDNSTLRKHENRHMGVVKSYPCKLCSKKFPEKAKLKYHISEVHLEHLELDVRRHHCHRCGKTFRNKYNLNKHVQSVHEKLFVCECPTCGQQLSDKSNLAAHLRIHFPERPYVCTHGNCAKRFKDKSTLKKHTAIHETHLHSRCRVCGATFSRTHRLHAHMRTHNVREKWAECDYCGVLFYTKNYLIKHIKQKHSKNKKKYICDQCGLTTYNKPSIVMHLKYGHLHDGDLYCKICKYKTKYKHLMYLKSHYLRTHNIRYKTMKRKKKVSKNKPSVEVKVEPLDEAEYSEEIHIIDVPKEEVIEEEDLFTENDLVTYSKQVLSEDLSECLLNDVEDAPETSFDQFLYKHVFHKTVKEEVPETNGDDVNETQRTYVTEKVKEIMKKSKETRDKEMLERRQRREAKVLERKLKREARLLRRQRRREVYELERVRQMYNERMKKAVANEGKRKEPVNTVTYFRQKTTTKGTTEKQSENNVLKNNNISDIQHNQINLDNNDVPLNKRTDLNELNDEVRDKNDTINDSHEIKDEQLDTHTDKDILPKNDDSINEMCSDSINEMIDPSNRENCTNSDELNTNDRKNDESDNTRLTINRENESRSINNTNTQGNPKNKSFDDKNLNENAKDDSTNDADILVGANNDSIDDSQENDSKDDKTDDDDSDYEPDSGPDDETYVKRMNFKTYQCYICFKLYPTKKELLSHCQSHFDICNRTTLSKCPVCAHVASAGIGKHMLNKHGIQIKIPYTKITDRKDNSAGSRYCYEVDDKGTLMEIIPSVKILNHNAAVQIDKKNRERREKTVAATRLVKKGKEWIVEHVAVNISFEELPEFTKQELRKLKVSNSYTDRLGQLSRLAKKRGLKMYFPCDKCDKICKNFSALKLHSRRHDPNKKPFAPKVYKYKKTKNKPSVKPPPAKKTPQVNLENRHAKPKPIMNKHKCDEKLKEFYETHIRGADIEFWQFLKIFNKMDRENIQDFKDFEGRPEFGIHTNEERNCNVPKLENTQETEETTSKTDQQNNPNPKATQSVSKMMKHSIVYEDSDDDSNHVETPEKVHETSSKTVPQSRNTNLKRKLNVKSSSKLYKRVKMISRKEHLQREKTKMKLREKIEMSKINLK